MKMNKRKSLSLALVIALIAILSFSSLAWFNAQDDVTNEFYIASTSEDDDITGDEIFSVDVWEEDEDIDGDGEITEKDKDFNGDGVVDEKDQDINGDGKVGDDDDRNGDGEIDYKDYIRDENGEVKDEFKDDDGKTFEDILPGGSYAKDPNVENTGAYDMWVRVSVSVSEAKAWESILRNGDTLNMQLADVNPKLDLCEEETTYDADKDERIYYYYYSEKLAPGEEFSVFTDFTIPGYLTQDDMAAIADLDFKVVVNVDAIQAENLPGNPDNAKDAFASVNWTAGQTGPQD